MTDGQIRSEQVRNSSADLSADVPETDPTRDRLGYAPFARHLARSLSRMAPSAGLVAAIFAPWGAGKTTLLNFVEYYLGHPEDTQGDGAGVENDSIEDADSPVETPVVMHFNPWWFSGHEDLTSRFFNQLLAELGEQERYKDLRTKIAHFAGIVGEAPIPYAGVGKAVAKAVQPATKDVFKLKDDVSKALGKQNIKILVVLDDLDRLTAEEIRQMFRLIKAVANFPNVMYLLAFDKAVAVEALGQVQGSSGEAYLEKIIQVSFELPLPDPTALRRMFTEKLDSLMVGTPEELFNAGYWGNVFIEGIDPFLCTPRDIVRLTNTLQVTYPAVIGEVNPVDFIALETLRVFQPAVYDIVRKNPQMFTGHTEASRLSGDQDVLTRFHEAWLAQVSAEDQDTIKALMARLFPKAEKIWRRMGHGPDWEAQWRRELRVCSGSIFPVYFRLAIPTGTLSQAEMQSVLAVTDDANALEAALLKFNAKKRPDGTTAARAVLERIQDYTEKDIPQASIPSVILTLANVGDKLAVSDVNPGTMFDLGIEMQMGRVCWQLLRRLSEPERFEVLRDAAQQGQAVGTLAREVMVLGQQHGKHGGNAETPEEDRLVSGEHLTDLENLVAVRIRQSAEDGTLLSRKPIFTLLSSWAEWESAEAPRAWVQQLIDSDEGLLSFLEKLVNYTRSQGIGEAVVFTQMRLNPDWIKPYTNPDIVAARLMALEGRKVIPEDHQEMVSQYLKEYELLQQGKNPDSPYS